MNPGLEARKHVGADEKRRHERCRELEMGAGGAHNGGTQETGGVGEIGNNRARRQKTRST